MKLLLVAVFAFLFSGVSLESQAGDAVPWSTGQHRSSPATSSSGPADTGFDNNVRAIGLYNGDLIVGGNFNMAAGFNAIKVAGWNGTQWYAMPNFPLGNPVYWLHEHGGLLYAGQALTQLNSWNGSAWTAHTPWLGNNFGNIWALETWNNELYVGGGFENNASQPSYIARWNGSGWDSVGVGIQGAVWALEIYNGNLVAAGGFDSSGGSVGNRIASWNGANWSPLGAGITDGGVRALTVFNGDLIVGGTFSTAGGVGVSHIASWNGATWQPLGNGLDGWVEAFCVHNNQLIAGGRFANSGSTPMPGVARWNGSSWSSLGTGLDDDVYALGEYNGYLIAGGAFSDAGGYVALWDGSVWRPVSDIVTDVDDVTAGTRPGEYTLAQNYPNPFNPTTQIAFERPAAGHVELRIFNILGQPVRRLINKTLPAGRITATWDGTDDAGLPVATGVYLYRINAGSYSDTRTMLLLK